LSKQVRYHQVYDFYVLLLPSTLENTIRCVGSKVTLCR